MRVMEEFGYAAADPSANFVGTFARAFAHRAHSFDWMQGGEVPCAFAHAFGNISAAVSRFAARDRVSSWSSIFAF